MVKHKQRWGKIDKRKTLVKCNVIPFWRKIGKWRKIVVKLHENCYETFCWQPENISNENQT
jgi:hypothetical protein